ncbi:hypothetical protein WMF04_19125 [Sorangium sp. So ce260]|uniref:hypothetical protein n=1 Tax=Sorangium sp. So ce260 TaxID=3133291 RepID=UPI003F5ECFED
MKKSILSSLVVVAAATLSASSMAHTIEWDVSIDTGVGLISEANTLKCDPSFYVEDTEGVYLGFPVEFCVRACKVVFEGDVPGSSNFFLLQKLNSGNYDCRDLDKKPNVGFVTNDRTKRSHLFFRNAKKRVHVFAGGMDDEGNMWGSCSFKGLDYVNYGCDFAAVSGFDDGEPADIDEEDEGDDTATGS